MKYVSRKNWGARATNDPTNITPATGGVAIHYVGGPGKLTPSSHLKCAGIVKGIQKDHIDDNGWADIAYSLLVCQHGYVFEGRGLHKRTAAQGTTFGNQYYYAICGLVNGADTPTKAMLSGIKEGLAYLRQKGGAGTKVRKHSFFHTTTCPGPLGKYVDDGFLNAHIDYNAYPGTAVKKGSKGAVVTKVQNRLLKLGYKLPKYGADGSFGDETGDAVEAFQKKNGLKQDRVVGPITWEKMF